MPKIITALTLLLAILLFPPATLALISNNAVPGDTTYPLKRGLEDVIYAVASLNPTTRAFFAAARSDRRFEEIKTLVSSGRSVKDSLQELVIQTDIAVKQIQKVEDPQKKKELIANLKQSIEKYDQGLTQMQKSYEKYQPQPTAAPVPISVTSPTPSTTPAPVVSPPSEAVNIEDTREDLEEIKKELEEEKQSFDMGKEILHKDDEKEKDSKKEKSDKDKEEGSNDKKTDKEGKNDDKQGNKKEDSKTGKKSDN